MDKRFDCKKVSLIFALILGFSSACGTKEEQPENGGTILTTENGVPTIETLIENDNPCNNIFYPLGLDNQWIYKLQAEGADGTPETSEMGLTVAEVNDSNAMLAALNYDSGIVTKSTVNCSNKAILNFPMTELNLIFGEIAGDINFIYKSGEFMPSETDFIAGDWKNSWKTEFLANGIVSGTYDNNSATVNLSDSPILMEWEIFDKDLSLQVDAGAFKDVVLIKRVISFDIQSLNVTFEGQDLDISTTLIINTNMWYAPNIGLLKQEIVSATVKLFGINFPIDSIGMIELKSSNLVN
jgi:hypothetical protein